MIKVIFLDLDGVVNSIESAKAIRRITGKRVVPGPVFVEAPYTRTNLNWSVRLVDNLGRLINYTGAKVVIISSWREKFTWPWSFQLMFGVYNLDNIDIIGLAPIHLSDRGAEISAWFADHKAVNGEGVESYVIIDDNDDFSIEQKEHLVLVDNKVGLTMQDVDKAMKILNHDKKDKAGVSGPGGEWQEPK